MHHIYKDDIDYKAVATNPLKKGELHSHLKSHYKSNPEMYCKQCIDQHTICPCAGIKAASFEIKQRSVFSNVKDYTFKGGIYTYIHTLGWDNNNLHLLLRIAANVSLSFWDCEALTMIKDTVCMPCLLYTSPSPRDS